MPDTTDTLHRRLQWFLLLRVGVMTCLLVMTGLLYYGFARDHSSSSGLVFRAIAFAYLISLASGLLLTRVQNLMWFSYTQVVFDTVFITGLILFTGGLHSPFPFLYHLAILNAALLLFRRGALIAASLAALSHGATLDLLYYQVLPHAGVNAAAFLRGSSASGGQILVHLIVHIASYYAIALLASYLTQRLSQVETLLVERDVALDRLTALQQTIIQTLESGVLITDSDGMIEYANNPLGEIAGCPPQLLVTRSLTDVFPSLPDRRHPGDPLEFAFSANGNDERILRATCSPLTDTYGNRLGALYSVQDITSVKELERDLENAAQLERAAAENGDTVADSFAGLIGRSRSMIEVFQLITKVATSDTTVLITGESGTGKELVARAIHEKRSRSAQPFVAVNCGAIPEALMESELFGTLKGAFTGAVNNRLGLFREANGGTLFLDEVGELPLALQVKLLRVLQDHEVTPVGSGKGVHVDVRVLAATNKDLEAAVKAGRFREDLFYRLNVIRVSLPPLRERKGDLPLLIHHFLRHFSLASGKEVNKVSPQAFRILLDYPYPGNIRELENVIQYAVTMTEGEAIQVVDLPSPLNPTSGPTSSNPTPTEHGHNNGVDFDFFDRGVSLDMELEGYEQQLLRAALEKADGVQKRAAAVLGINYRSFRHRIQKYHLLS